MVAPQGIDELIRAHRLALARRQGLQNDTVARTQTSRAIHGQWTENGDVHTTTVLGEQARVNGTDTRWIPDEGPTGTGVRENCRRRAARPANMTGAHTP